MLIKLFAGDNEDDVERKANNWLRLNKSIEVLKTETTFAVIPLPKEALTHLSRNPFLDRCTLTLWYNEKSSDSDAAKK